MTDTDKAQIATLGGRQNIVKTLRTLASMAKTKIPYGVTVGEHILNDTADEIARLRAQLAQAVEALEQFAKAAAIFDDLHIRNPEEQYVYAGSRMTWLGAISIADLRRARAALAAIKGDDNG